MLNSYICCIQLQVISVLGKKRDVKYFLASCLINNGCEKGRECSVSQLTKSSNQSEILNGTSYQNLGVENLSMW